MKLTVLRSTKTYLCPAWLIYTTEVNPVGEVDVERGHGDYVATATLYRYPDHCATAQGRTAYQAALSAAMALVRDRR